MSNGDVADGARLNGTVFCKLEHIGNGNDIDEGKS